MRENQRSTAVIGFQTSFSSKDFYQKVQAESENFKQHGFDKVLFEIDKAQKITNKKAVK